MKQLLSFLFITIISLSVTKSQGRAAAGEDWKLSNAEVSGMLERLNECGIFKPCHNNSRVLDPNNDVYQWIVQTYGSTCNITNVDARYRDDDEDRYRRLRGLDDTRSKVRGFKTLLVKVEPRRSKGALNETIYFDCYTICPPPSDCGVPNDSSN